MAMDLEKVALEPANIQGTDMIELWVPRGGDRPLFKEVLHLPGDDGEYTEEQFIAVVGAALQMFLGAEPKVVAAMPQTELVWRPRPDNPDAYAGFIVTQRIFGPELADVAAIDEPHAIRLDGLFAALVRMAARNQTGGGLVEVPDILTWNGPFKNVMIESQWYVIDFLPPLAENIFPSGIWRGAYATLVKQAGGFKFPAFRAEMDRLIGYQGWDIASPY